MYNDVFWLTTAFSLIYMQLQPVLSVCLSADVVRLPIFSTLLSSAATVAAADAAPSLLALNILRLARTAPRQQQQQQQQQQQRRGRSCGGGSGGSAAWMQQQRRAPARDSTSSAVASGGVSTRRGRGSSKQPFRATTGTG
jgi:hypothetical protein